MSTFDPDTGLRVAPEAAGERRVRNPYDVALTLVWTGSAGTAVLLLLLTTATTTALEPAPILDRPGTLVSLVLLGFAAVAGVAHLASHAARWRPPPEA